MGKKPFIVTISSGKGGVGKTTCSVNLATAIKNQVLVIDGDLGLANVDIMLGVNARHTLRETLEYGRDPSELVLETKAGFHVLPASSGVPEMATLNQNEQAIFHKAVQSVVAGFDTIIIDTAAGIGESVLMLNEMATCNCIVLTPDPTSFTDAYALIKILYKRLDCKVFHLIINETKSKKEGEQVFRHMQTVLKTFLNIDPLLLGIIPKDTKVVAAVRQRTPLMLTSPDSRAAKAIQRIAQRISSLMT